MKSFEFLKNYRNKKKKSNIYDECTKSYKVAGEPLLECRDAIMKIGQYKGMRLTDIFIFNSEYLRYLLKGKNIDDGLKDIAKEVIDNQGRDGDDIATEISLS